MILLRSGLIAVVLMAGAIINSTVSPQVYLPRQPVANGIDIASRWEWRSMAIKEHSWWLSHHFPGVTVTNVAYAPPPQSPKGLDVGIRFGSWRDTYLDITIDDTFPPLDASALGIREQLLESGKVFSRIHCRDNQEQTIRDACFYFVAWDDQAIYETQITRLGLEPRVTIQSGYVPPGEFSELFSSHDLLVMPYRSGTGSIVRELAFRYGLPVIATYVGSIAEGITHDVNGLIIPAHSVEALTAALASAANPSTLARWKSAIGDQARLQDTLWLQYCGVFLPDSDRSEVTNA